MDIRKRFFTKRTFDQALEQTPQDSGHGTKPVRVQETFAQNSQTYCLILEWTQELDSIILVSQFQQIISVSKRYVEA